MRIASGKKHIKNKTWCPACQQYLTNSKFKTKTGKSYTNRCRSCHNSLLKEKNYEALVRKQVSVKPEDHEKLIILSKTNNITMCDLFTVAIELLENKYNNPQPEVTQVSEIIIELEPTNIILNKIEEGVSFN